MTPQLRHCRRQLRSVAASRHIQGARCRAARDCRAHRRQVLDRERMTCLRLTELIQRNAARHAVGMMVDRVRELPGRTPAHLRPAPRTSVPTPGGHAAVIGSAEDRAAILIELEEILSCAGRGQVEHAPHQPATGFIPRH